MLLIKAVACYFATVNPVERCKDVQLAFAEETSSLTPQQCIMIAQTELAKWTEANPNWRIVRFSCNARSVPIGEEKKDI